MSTLLALTVLVPLAGSVLILAAGSGRGRAPGHVATGAVAASFSFSLILLPVAGHGVTARGWTWFALDGLDVSIGLQLDPLTAILAVVVTGVGFLVHLYSIAFMADEPDHGRFFAAMNLFVASMLVLVLADDLVLLYLGWEGVGLCSFLLIGFWYDRPAAVAAARKALIVTRIGDAAMALGLFLLVTELGTLEIDTLLARATERWSTGDALAVTAAALLVAGAFGKSAQLPLHGWLPDAMAGPTPVSALIHAATMVTAGVFLLARVHPLLELAPAVQTVVAWVGLATLLLAALAALVQHDLKRILAWSTISQLGYMFVGLGAGAAGAAVFHLFTHAFFKALLFLGAGSVALRLHHEHDVARMGGLRRAMPLTFWTFAIGAGALAGVPFVTAGFFSKEWILASTFTGPVAGGVWLWMLSVVGIALTAAYATRAVIVVFFGPMRTEAVGATPRTIAVPLVLLALASITAGWLQTPSWLGGVHAFESFLGDHATAAADHPSVATELGLAAAALIAVAVGFLVAVRRFGTQTDSVDWGFGTTLDRALRSGLGVDAATLAIVARPWVMAAHVGRRDVFDAIGEGIGRAFGAMHHSLSLSQNGRVRWTVGAIVIGCVLLLVVEAVA